MLFFFFIHSFTNIHIQTIFCNSAVKELQESHCQNTLTAVGKQTKRQVSEKKRIYSLYISNDNG
jgi:hypothetical protein